MRTPGHPNKLSVRWIYCKQSLQEDHPAAARWRETSGLAAQQARDGLADFAGREKEGVKWQKLQTMQNYI